MARDPAQEVWKSWKSLGTPGVLVTVSGGADSVALLLLLEELRRTLAHRHAPRLVVAHLDHGLRVDSAQDGSFVARLADGLGLEHRSARLDPSEAAWVRGDAGTSAPGWLTEQAGDGIQARARALRRGLFERWAEEGDLERIAWAHTLDDQAETFLLAALRGAGRGLGGMASRGPSRAWRPLLGLPRARLRTWLEARQQTWREDASNQDPRFDRVRVRRDLLPLLEGIRPGVTGVLAHLAAEQRELRQLLAEQVEAAAAECLLRLPGGVVELDLEACVRRGPAVTRELVRQQLAHQLGRPAARGLLEEVLAILGGDRVGASVELPGGRAAVRSRSGLRLGSQGSA